MIGSASLLSFQNTIFDRSYYRNILSNETLYGMIGYYLHSGDEQSADMFTPYIWGTSGLGKRIKDQFKDNDFGTDLDLILIKYYMEGKFSSYLPLEPKMGNYLSKSKDIGLDIGVTREAFHDRNEFERREFVVDSTMKAVMLAHKRLSKRKLNINFELLTNKLQIIARDFLIAEEKYSSI